MTSAESGCKGVVGDHILGKVATLTHLGHGMPKGKDSSTAHTSLAAVSKLETQPRISVIFKVSSSDTGTSPRKSPPSVQFGPAHHSINQCSTVYIRKNTEITQVPDNRRVDKYSQSGTPYR